MSSYELTFTDIPKTDRNLKTGRFIKGMTPHNKGKKWSEWMDGRKQKRVKKQALKNLETARRLGHCGMTGGRNKRPIIAVFDNGEWLMFPEQKSAAAWCGGNRYNVGRCCRENARHKELLKPFSHPTGRINNDHKYMGVRWYFEDTNDWIEKIKQ